MRKLSGLDASGIASAAVAAGIASAATTGTFAEGIYEVSSDQPSFVKSGASPTATGDGSSMYLPAGVPRRIFLRAGDKLAAIRAGASDGTVYVTPVLQ